MSEFVIKSQRAGSPPRPELPARPQEMSVESLYDQFSKATFLFFANKTRSQEMASDLNQELYLRLASSVRTYRGDCSWRTWVFAIARIVIADSRRRSWRQLQHREVSLDTESIQRDLIVPQDADRHALHILLRQRLVICLRLLDEAARAVVVAHYSGEVTLEQLTARLRLANPSGARAILIAAQRKLRRCLQKGRTHG